MSTVRTKPIAVLNLPRPVPAMLKASAAIIAAMTGNGALPNAGSLLIALGTAQKALDAAETATKARTRGTAEARDAARAALVSQLLAARVMVQQAADAANPDQAASIITGAGMAVKKPKPRTKASFAATQGATSGVVRLDVRSVGHRACYDWQWSSDAGHTWLQVPSTLQAKTTVAGLPAGSTPMFRFRAVTKSGVGDWSQPTSLLVQ